MRIDVEHHTTREIARTKVEQKLGQLLSQFGGQAQEMQHEWVGDTLRFHGKARGLTLEGTVEVTDDRVILDSKLPMMAKMFEGRIRETVQREAESIFRTA